MLPISNPLSFFLPFSVGNGGKVTLPADYFSKLIFDTAKLMHWQCYIQIFLFQILKKMQQDFAHIV